MVDVHLIRRRDHGPVRFVGGKILRQFSKPGHIMRLCQFPSRRIGINYRCERRALRNQFDMSAANQTRADYRDTRVLVHHVNLPEDFLEAVNTQAEACLEVTIAGMVDALEADDTIVAI